MPSGRLVARAFAPRTWSTSRREFRPERADREEGNFKGAHAPGVGRRHLRTDDEIPAVRIGASKGGKSTGLEVGGILFAFNGVNRSASAGDDEIDLALLLVAPET